MTGASVTADTLEALQGPDRTLFLMLGADAVANMGTWRRLDDTSHLAEIVVVERAGDLEVHPPGEGWRVHHVAVPRLDISSTDLRDRLAAGAPDRRSGAPSRRGGDPPARASTLASDADRVRRLTEPESVVQSPGRSLRCRGEERHRPRSPRRRRRPRDHRALRARVGVERAPGAHDRRRGRAGLTEYDGSKPISIEGLGDASWVLLDYGDIVVHVFLDETRAYYDLDRLWGDVPRLEIEVPMPQAAT